MGSEQDAAFYDARLERVLIPYETSPWRPVYDAVISLLPEDKATNIVDIGCGTGRCAEAIRRAGYRVYKGLDFSPRRVEEAARYVPVFTFKVLDCFSDEAQALYDQCDAAVLTEVLEHLERDRELLAMIPSGKTVIFSVPNYNSAGHVRTYASAAAVEDRYGDLLKLEGEALEFPSPRRPHNKVFTLRAARI